MSLREGTSGRVQPIAGQYLADPSVCCMCSRPPRNEQEPFLNLTVELEYFGVLYLCTDCGSEIAEAMGYIPHERHLEMSQLVESQSALLTEDDNQISYLKGLLNARIDLARFSQPDSNGTSGIPVFEDESGQDSVDAIIDGLESVTTESGTRN